MLPHLPYQFVPPSPFWPHGPPEALPNFSLTKSGTCPLKQPASRPGRKLCPFFPRNFWTLPFVPPKNRQGPPEALPDFSEPFLYLDDEIEAAFLDCPRRKAVFSIQLELIILIDLDFVIVPSSCVLHVRPYFRSNSS